MALPRRDEARDWLGRTVVDREGVDLGPVTAVLADEATGLPEWLYVEVDGAGAVVPAVDADGSGDRVTVSVTRAQVSAAPSVGGTSELSQAQEEQLYRHYGIGYSRETSESLLPAEATDTGATTGRRGRRPVVAAIALVGVTALGVAAARRAGPGRPPERRLRVRRPWASRRRTRAELAAERVHAASWRVRAGAGQLATAAASGATTAAEAARRGTAAWARRLRSTTRATSHAAASGVARARARR